MSQSERMTDRKYRLSLISKLRSVHFADLSRLVFGLNSVAGERYFTCKPNFGGFVRPDKVQVGDFPADDFDLDFDDDEEM